MFCEMKKVITYACLAVLGIFFFSCENKSKSKEDKVVENIKEIEIVEDASSSSFDIRSSYNRDIINDLYKEVLKENKALAELERTTDELLEKESDAEGIFKHYNSRNESYYRSAQN